MHDHKTKTDKERENGTYSGISKIRKIISVRTIRNCFMGEGPRRTDKISMSNDEMMVVWLGRVSYRLVQFKGMAGKRPRKCIGKLKLAGAEMPGGRKLEWKEAQLQSPSMLK